MEQIYAILTMIVVVLSNIVCTRAIADRYKFDGDDVSVFIGSTSVLAFIISALRFIVAGSPLYNIPIGIMSIVWAALAVPAAWIMILVGFHTVRGFIRNFSKILPKLSAAINNGVDSVLSLRTGLFKRSRKQLIEMANNDKAKEVKRLEAMVAALSMQLGAISSQEAEPLAITDDSAKPRPKCKAKKNQA